MSFGGSGPCSWTCPPPVSNISSRSLLLLSDLEQRLVLKTKWFTVFRDKFTLSDDSLRRRTLHYWYSRTTTNCPSYRFQFKATNKQTIFQFFPMMETRLVGCFLFELHSAAYLALWPLLPWLASKSPSLFVTLLKVGSQRWCGMPGVQRVCPGLRPRWPPTARLEAAHSSLWYVFSRCFELLCHTEPKTCTFQFNQTLHQLNFMLSSSCRGNMETSCSHWKEEKKLRYNSKMPVKCNSLLLDFGIYFIRTSNRSTRVCHYLLFEPHRKIAAATVSRKIQLLEDYCLSIHLLCQLQDEL